MEEETTGTPAGSGGSEPESKAGFDNPGADSDRGKADSFKVDMSALTEDDVRDLLERARQREEYLERLQILQAEHENFRKRMTREAANHRLWALRDLALDILPAVDNLERALGAPIAAGDDQALRAGVRIVLDMLLEALSRHGARPIEALGKQFDPAFHEAMGEMPTADMAPGKVAADVQKGYTLKDIVIRPSRVMVAAAVKKEPEKQ